MKLSLGFVTTVFLAVASALPSIPTTATDIVTRDDGLNGTDLETNSLEARGVTIHHVDCNYGTWANRYWIDDLEKELRGTPWCSVSGKPNWRKNSNVGECRRLGCNRGTEVWLCNDTTTFFKVKGSVIADLVRRAMTDCVLVDGNFVKTRGQIFTTDNWNLIVTRADYC